MEYVLFAQMMLFGIPRTNDFFFGYPLTQDPSSSDSFRRVALHHRVHRPHLGIVIQMHALLDKVETCTTTTSAMHSVA